MRRLRRSRLLYVPGLRIVASGENVRETFGLVGIVVTGVPHWRRAAIAALQSKIETDPPVSATAGALQSKLRAILSNVRVVICMLTEIVERIYGLIGPVEQVNKTLPGP